MCVGMGAGNNSAGGDTSGDGERIGVGNGVNDSTGEGSGDGCRTGDGVGAGTNVSASAGQNIFTTVLDKPGFGYYWYICEVRFDIVSGDVTPGVFTTGLRSLTAQVIKQ